MSKKILIVSASFYPENSPRSFRTTELVKELSRMGHDVTVIAPFHTEQEGLIREYGFKMEDLGQRNWPEISYNGNFKLLQWIARIIRRVLLIIFEYPEISWMFKVKKALKGKSGYDLMISIAVPHMVHWGVSWAIRKKGQIARTWVADCGDPYMGVQYDKFSKPFYFKYFEKWFCAKADFITVPVKGAVTAYYPEYRDKIRVIPQGFNISEVKEHFKPYIDNNVPTFIYAGNFIPGRRDIRPLLDYMLKSDVDFRCYIYTMTTDLIKNYELRSKGKVIVHPFIPRNKLLSRLSEMDFLLNLENGVSEQVPSKLIDYFLSERAILSIDSSNIDFNKVDQFLRKDYSAQLKSPDMTQYDIHNICKSFLELANHE